MSNIRKAFTGKKAFIPFITCGDPDLDTTAKIVRSAVAAGASLIELGIPFSDPTAEGMLISYQIPVIVMKGRIFICVIKSKPISYSIFTRFNTLFIFSFEKIINTILR